MKRAILCCTLLLGISKAFAQAPPTDSLITGLINSIYMERVNPAAKFYYLDEKGENPEFDKYDIVELQRETKLVKEVPLEEFATAIANDTTSVNWNNYHLKNAKCLPKNPTHYSYGYRIVNIMPFSTPDSTIQMLQNKGTIAFRVKKKLSKKQLQKETDKAVENYEKQTPIEHKNFYRFSKPIFSKNRQYVLIALDGNERGCRYIFKLTDGHWIRVYKFRCWVV